MVIRKDFGTFLRYLDYNKPGHVFVDWHKWFGKFHVWIEDNPNVSVTIWNLQDLLEMLSEITERKIEIFPAKELV